MSYRAIVGELVRRLRVHSNLTQSAVGALLERSAANVSRVESGRYPLTVDELRTLCVFFGLMPFQLVRAADTVVRALKTAGIDVPSIDKPDRIAIKAKELGAVFSAAVSLLDLPNPQA